MSHETESAGPRSVALSAVQGDRVLILKIPGELLSREAVMVLLESIDAGLGEGLHVCHGVDASETYAYSVWPKRARMEALVEIAGARYPGAQAVVMDVIQALEGASAGGAAHWHYVVETDVAEQAEDDFNAWYGQEHLPGLASVPGTVRALRLHGSDAAPHYHALYLLETRETFGSPPWLAVRATDWSSRVRPHFQNTKRTMFTVKKL